MPDPRNEVSWHAPLRGGGDEVGAESVEPVGERDVVAVGVDQAPHAHVEPFDIGPAPLAQHLERFVGRVEVDGLVELLDAAMVDRSRVRCRSVWVG